MASPRLEKTQEPSIYKRGGRYVFVWRDRGRQVKEFFPTMALAREAKRQRQAPDADRRKRRKVRFRDYACTWIESYRGRTARGFSDETRKEYRRDLEANLIPYFGGWQLSEVEPPDVKEWFGWMESRGVSASGVRKAKAVLSALYADAKEDGTVKDNPVSGVRYRPAQGVRLPSKIEPLTVAEFDRLREALPEQWRLFFVLLAHTGLRISELLGRRWRDIDLSDNASMNVHDQVYEGERKALKTASARRTLRLSPDMATALHNWRKATDYPEDGDPVFPSSTGTPFNYANLWNRVWAPARDAAGIEGAGAFHRIRHTCASLIHESGQKSARQLSDWMGHSDPAFTQRVYVGQMDAGLGDAEFLDDLIPVNGWANSGQQDTHSQPQNGNGELPTGRLATAENGQHPQPAADT